jgi:hypothetical protein
VYSFLNHVAVHLARGMPHYMHFVAEAVLAACGAAYIFYSENTKGPRH